MLNTWCVNDDELVDLLHTKFFTSSIEQDFELKETTKIDDLISKFTGCYRVHQSDFGASLCGQLSLGDEETDTGKFVMLLKLKPDRKGLGKSEL